MHESASAVFPVQLQSESADKTKQENWTCNRKYCIHSNSGKYAYNNVLRYANESETRE